MLGSQVNNMWGKVLPLHVNDKDSISNHLQGPSIITRGSSLCTKIEQPTHSRVWPQANKQKMWCQAQSTLLAHPPGFLEQKNRLPNLQQGCLPPKSLLPLTMVAPSCSFLMHVSLKLPTLRLLRPDPRLLLLDAKYSVYVTGANV